MGMARIVIAWGDSDEISYHGVNRLATSVIFQGQNVTVIPR
jgi:hypothetical protein